MKQKKLLFTIMLVLSMISLSLFAQIPLTNTIPAAGVLGTNNFVTNTNYAPASISTLSEPAGVAVDPTTGKLFVADRDNRRVLRYSSAAKLISGSSPEAVFGQPDYVTRTANTGGISASTMNNPNAVYVDGSGRLWVADRDNNRILRFDNASTKASSSAADGVLGQLTFTTNTANTTPGTMSAPAGIFVDGNGRLWVADRANNRVTRFDSAATKANGGVADGVLGQPDLLTGTSGTDSIKMSAPWGVTVDGSGRLWVADRSNSRVLRFDNAATLANGSKANGVLGQTTFNTATYATTQAGLGEPRGVTVDASGRLYVADEGNSRIMVYNSGASKANGANADFVIGQVDFTLSAAPNPPTATSLAYALSLFIDPVTNNVWVPDLGNHRILRFDIGPRPAVGVLGQANLVTVPVSAAPTASTLKEPKGIALDPTTGKLFVADYQNRRVLRWSSAAKMIDGSPAEAVLGEPDFTTNTGGTSSTLMLRPYGICVDAAGRLWVADLSGNRVLRFDNASTIVSGSPANRVLGQADFGTATANTGGISASSMWAPVGVFVDGAGRLWVAERDNKRILRFDNAASKSNGDPADGVLGEPDFATNAGGLTAALITRGYGITGDASGRIWVADRDNNRVLRFDAAAAKVNGAAADGVIGQTDFVSKLDGRTQSGFSGPRGIIMDAVGKLFVNDEGNNRVLVFDSAATKGNGPNAINVFGQTDYISAFNPNPPTAGSMNYAEFLVVDDINKFIWLADEFNNRIVRYNEGGTPVVIANFFVTPKTIASGSVVVSTIKKDSVTVFNSGSAALVIDSVKSDNGVFTVSPALATVPANGEQKFYLNFAPTSVGLKSGNIVFTRNSVSKKDTVTVNGTGVQASFAISSKSVSFGGVLSGQAKKDSVTVTNSGTFALQIDSVKSDNVMFTVTPSGLTSIPPSGTQKFYLNFTPTSTGAKTGNAVFYHNATNKKDTVKVDGTGVTGAFFTEDFTAAVGTALTSAGWTISGTSVVNPITITTPGLSIGKYSGSAVGNAVTLANTGQDLYNSFPSINQGSVYFSMMVRVDSAGTGDYFIALSPTSSQTNYYARLHMKSSGTGYNVGLSKSNEVSGGSQYGTTVLSFKTTYLVVVKYTFTGTLADSTNDPISVHVFASTIPATEPATPEINAYVNATKNDAVNIGYVTLRQGGGAIAPQLVIDGLRIGTSWTTGVPTGVNVQLADIPQSFELLNNYPNPFNPTTTIKFGLPEASEVSLKIYDVLGREVATVINSMLAAGYYNYNWNASGLSSGMYIYRITAASSNGNKQQNFTQSRKMLLQK